MKPSRLTSGFPDMINQIVAEAATKLPPLEEERQFEFLGIVQDQAIGAYFMNYASTCPQEVQDVLREALENNDRSAQEHWMQTYMDLAHDADAARRAEIVLEDLAEKLPEIIRGAYDDFIQPMT